MTALDIAVCDQRMIIPPFASSRRFAMSTPCARIQFIGSTWLVVHPDLEVQVAAGGVAGAADEAERLPGLDLLALSDEQPGGVPVDGDDAAAVVNDHAVAVPAVVRGQDDGAGVRRVVRSCRTAPPGRCRSGTRPSASPRGL